MTGEEKLEFVRDQCLKIWREGKEMEMSCPYCLSVVPVGAPACCPTMQRAIEAIVEGQLIIERIDFANRVLDRHMRN